MSDLKKLIISLIAVSSLFLLSALFYSHQERNFKTESIIKSFQNTFLKQELEALELLHSVSSDLNLYSEQTMLRERWVKEVNDLYYSNGQIVVVSRGDSILFLSNNALPLSHGQLPDISIGIKHILNGWYYINSESHDDFTIAVYSLIKKDYRYKNRFLINEFFHRYEKITHPFNLSLDSDQGYPVYNNLNDFVFSLVPDPNKVYVSKSYFYVSTFLAIVALLILLGVILSVFSRLYLKGYYVSSIAGLFLTLLFVRWIMFYFQIPGVIYQGYIFSAAQYATSHILPSLGDLLINVFMVNVFLFFGYLRIRSVTVLNQSSRWTKIIVGIVLLTLLITYGYFILDLLKGLVINSHLNLNVNFIFNLDF
jgi:two-component system, NtrC family, nitrogen regulation sensor histidine kinase NtrY